ARAARLAADARAYAERHGMRRLLSRLDGLAPRPAAPHAVSAPTARTAVLRKEGDYWRIGWEGAEFRLRDRVGLHHLAALIAGPAREVLAVDLVRARGARGRAPDLGAPGVADLGPGRRLTSADSYPDLRAELDYRRRLNELRAIVEEARDVN